jgi:hypothetical protein
MRGIRADWRVEIGHFAVWAGLVLSQDLTDGFRLAPHPCLAPGLDLRSGLDHRPPGTDWTLWCGSPICPAAPAPQAVPPTVAHPGHAPPQAAYPGPISHIRPGTDLRHGPRTNPARAAGRTRTGHSSGTGRPKPLVVAHLAACQASSNLASLALIRGDPSRRSVAIVLFVPASNRPLTLAANSAASPSMLRQLAMPETLEPGYDKIRTPCSPGSTA